MYPKVDRWRLHITGALGVGEEGAGLCSWWCRRGRRSDRATGCLPSQTRLVGRQGAVAALSSGAALLCRSGRAPVFARRPTVLQATHTPY